MNYLDLSGLHCLLNVDLMISDRVTLSRVNDAKIPNCRPRKRVTDIPAGRKSHSKAEDFDQITKFATTNLFLIFVAILFHT